MTEFQNNDLVLDVRQRLDKFASTKDPGKRFSQTLSNLENDLRICESPIEQVLLIEVTRLLTEHELTHFCRVLPQIWAYYTEDRAEREICVTGVRLDFLVCFRNRWDFVHSSNEGLLPFDNHPSLLPLFAVECDGRDYHTHEAQIQRDKTRDRVLTSLGLTTIRFTGSEINNNPINSAWEVFNLFVVHFRDILDNGVNRAEFIEFSNYPPGAPAVIQMSNPKLKQFKRLFLSDRKHTELLEYDATYINDVDARNLGLIDD